MNVLIPKDRDNRLKRIARENNRSYSGQVLEYVDRGLALEASKKLEAKSPKSPLDGVEHRKAV